MSIAVGSGAVAVDIDAAVVANQHIVARRPEAGRPGTVVDDFVVPPTLAGMERLARRLVPWPGAVAVAEPTSTTWLPLSIALGTAGVELSLVGNRHSARLRSALAARTVGPDRRRCALTRRRVLRADWGPLSAAMRSCPVAATNLPAGGQSEDLPGGGQLICPR